MQPGPVVFLLAHKKIIVEFVAFGLRLILISCDVKNMEKTATGTWHYVNRLVPKNDIKCKMIIKPPKLIIKQPGIIKNYRYIGDVS